MVLKNIRKLMKTEKYEEALAKLEGILPSHQECCYLWILRGDLIQLLDTQAGPPLKEAARSYRKALALDPKNPYALESLAHFYDAVDQQPEKAKYYANAYISEVRRGLTDMERISSDQ